MLAGRRHLSLQEHPAACNHVTVCAQAALQAWPATGCIVPAACRHFHSAIHGMVKQADRLAHAGDHEACTIEGEPHDAEPDICSRYFGPWTGANEDPVTGSAHCVLAPYFTRKLGKPDLRARQCSHRPGGMVLQYSEGDANVTLIGDAHVVIRGDIALPALTSAVQAGAQA